MTFLADEGVDRQIVERLRLDGHQVAYVPGHHATLAAARLLPGLGLALRESTARRECGRDQEA